MQVLKRFFYSHDGKKPIEAKVGDGTDDIPMEYFEGLIAEGFIGSPTSGTAEPEPEPAAASGDLADLRAQYRSITGSEPDKRWSAATLQEKIIEA